jgi:hypothetical protein
MALLNIEREVLGQNDKIEALSRELRRRSQHPHDLAQNQASLMSSIQKFDDDCVSYSIANEDQLKR